MEARERSVRAEKCMEKVEADVNQWKEDVASERKKRADWEAMKKKKGGRKSSKGMGVVRPLERQQKSQWLAVSDESVCREVLSPYC